MEVNKAHLSWRTPYGFQISPYLQELVVFCCQNHVFEDASEQLAKLAGVEVTAKQVERLTHAYGELIEINLENQDNESPPKDALHYCPVCKAQACLPTRQAPSLR